MAIVSIVAGLLLLGNPFETMETVVAIAGGCLIYQSISDILTTFFINKRHRSIKKQAAEEAGK